MSVLDVWTVGALVSLFLLFAWSVSHGDWALDWGTAQEAATIVVVSLMWPVFLVVFVVMLMPIDPRRRP